MSALSSTPLPRTGQAALPLATLLVDRAVLVVDDLTMMRDLVTMMCRRLGFGTIDGAADGTRALACLRERSYALVISDLQMEPMTGLELLRAVRADGALRTTPFLMMTASLDTEQVIAAKRAGVDNYLVKPFTPAVLREKVQSIFG